MEYQERYMEQEPYRETSGEMKFAIAIAVTVLAFDVSGSLLSLPSMVSFDWIIVWRALTYGIAWGGLSYAVVLIVLAVAPNLPALLRKEVEDVTGKQLGKPDLPTGQPKRERSSVQTLPLVESPIFEDEPIKVEDLPPWITAVDKIVWGDRLNINNQLFDIPDGFNVDWLYTVGEARYEGTLPTISTIKLNSLGISRWQVEGLPNSPAAMVLSVLEQGGCIESRGTNQPCDWTDVGERVFPYPTDD